MCWVLGLGYYYLHVSFLSVGSALKFMWAGNYYYNYGIIHQLEKKKEMWCKHYDVSGEETVLQHVQINMYLPMGDELKWLLKKGGWTYFQEL